MIKFIELHKYIQYYYPIGIIWENTNFEQEYPGLIEIQVIRKSKQKGELHYKWKKFLDIIRNEFPSELDIHSETFLDDVCYTGVIILDEAQKVDWRYRLTLNFHISLITPYFTILVKEEMFKKGANKAKAFRPILHISPDDNFGFYFKLIRKKIEEHYENYHFLPYSLLKTTVPALYIDGVSLPNLPDIGCSIFQAFFTKENINDYLYYGDFGYR